MIRYNLFYCLLVFLCFISCYDDEGNYDYQEVRNFVIDGLKPMYREKQFGDSLVISTVVVKTSDSVNVLPHDQFTFEWWLGNGTSLKSIGCARELKLGLNIDEKEYSVYVGATDQNTGITSYAETRLLVHSDLFEGWVFLCEDKEGNGTLDMLSMVYLSDTEKEVSVLKKALNSKVGAMADPEKIFFRYGGAPRMMLGFEDFCFLADFSKHTVEGSDNLIYEMAVQPNHVQLQWVCRNFYKEYLIIDNDLYMRSTFEMAGRPINVYQGKKFKIAPGLLLSRFSTVIVMYDIENQRFMKCAVSAWGGETSVAEMKPGDKFPWNDKWQFMHMEPDRFQNNSYSILKDDDNSIHLCCFNVEEQKWHKIIKQEATHIDEAKWFAFHKYAPILYYAYEDKLYEYNFEDPDPTEHAIASYDGREIVKICFHNLDESNKSKGKYKDLDRRLLVCVNDLNKPTDSRGAFYIYRVENKESLQELEFYENLSHIVDFDYKEHSDY